MAAISIVVTARDDRDGLAELLAALAVQRRPADEIVIVNAGSSDGSDELIAYWRGRGLPLVVRKLPGAGISAGRNHGIAAAINEHIAITDAGCRPQPDWLGALARELETHDFVAGTYEVERATPFEHAVAVSLYPDLEELRARPGPLGRTWLRLFGRTFRVDRATGRSMAFTRACWRAAGGFPEQVNTGEDVAFSTAALASARRATLAPDAVVRWRGRQTWSANARMYWRYAEGDAILGAQPRAFIRGGAWALAGLLLLSGGRRGRAMVSAGALAYVSLPVARARRTGLAFRHWWRIPGVLALKDLAMLGGTLAGLWRRSAIAASESPGRSEAVPQTGERPPVTTAS
jgi:GT2 family glycosyltransferase